MLQATLRPKAAIVSKKKKIHFLPYKSLPVCNQILPWCKIGQGQSKVIIWTTLVVLTQTMLLTKFQGHQSIGSGEDFLRFLPYMGMVAMLVMFPPTHLYKFSFPFSLKLSYELWFWMAQLFLRKTSFNFEIWVTFDQGQRMALTFDFTQLH